MEWLDAVAKWLNSNSGAISAVAAVVAAIIAFIYTRYTQKLLLAQKELLDIQKNQI